jgi:Uma2 family endonuclease
MSTVPKQRLTPQEYLAIERGAPTKHEYFRGEMFAMGGASTEHNQITFNLATELGSQLKNRSCVAYVNDMRVHVPATGLYTYPDVVVTCDKPRFEDQELDTLLNPQVIVEVVSDSTEAYDRGRKFKLYMQIDSLRDYILVAQLYASIDHYARDDAGNWKLRNISGMDAEFEIPTIRCKLRLAEIYAKVDFPPESEIDKAAGLFTDEESR